MKIQDEERCAVLKLFRECVSRYEKDPLLLYLLHSILVQGRRGRDDSGFQTDVEVILKEIPHSLEFGLLRAGLSYAWLEFPSGRWESEKDRDKEQEMWGQFLRHTSARLAEACSDSEKLIGTLISLSEAAFGADFKPKFGPILWFLAEHDPSRGKELADYLMNHADLELAADWISLVHGFTAKNSPERLTEYRQAILVKEEAILSSLVQGLMGDLCHPDCRFDFWELLLEVARSATTRVAGELLRYLEYPPKVNFPFGDLLKAFPEEALDEAVGKQYFNTLGYLIRFSENKPKSDEMPELLKILVRQKNLGKRSAESEFRNISNHAPLAFFNFLEKRLNHSRQLSKEEKTEYDVLPWLSLEGMCLHGVIPEEGEAEFVKRIRAWGFFAEDVQVRDEAVLLGAALLAGDATSDKSMMILLEEADSSKDLKKLAELIRFSRIRYPMISPKWTGAFLEKCATLNCFEECREDLVSVCGHFSRGSVNGEPDEKWQSKINRMQELAAEHSGHTILGSFYREILGYQMQAVKSNRERMLQENHYD